MWHCEILCYYYFLPQKIFLLRSLDSMINKKRLSVLCKVYFSSDNGCSTSWLGQKEGCSIHMLKLLKAHACCCVPLYPEAVQGLIYQDFWRQTIEPFLFFLPGRLLCQFEKPSILHFTIFL